MIEPRPDWIANPCVIFCGGPSLTADDVSVVMRSPAKTIVVNERWRVAPDADVLYAADRMWWRQRAPSADEFRGERWTQDKAWETTDPLSLGLSVVESRSGASISTDSTYVYQGSNSPFQAMGLAYHWGARRIVFLGLDLQYGPSGETHGHEYPDDFKRGPSSLLTFRAAYEAAAPKLQQLGVDVVNASRSTALTCFRREPIGEVLSHE